MKDFCIYACVSNIRIAMGMHILGPHQGGKKDQKPSQARTPRLVEV